MSKNVTEYGKEITDILRDTPNSLQGLQGLITLYQEFVEFEVNGLTTATIENFVSRLRLAGVLLGSMQDKAEQIQADFERLEMVCDEMQKVARKEASAQ